MAKSVSIAELQLTGDDTGLTPKLAAVAAQLEEDDAKAKQLGETFTDSATKAGRSWQAVGEKMQQVGATMQRVGQQATLIGAGLVAGVGAAANAVGSYADEVGDFANTFGLATSDVRALDIVLSEADVKLQAFGASMVGVSNRMKAAREGDEQAVKTFAKLGINVNDARIQAMSMTQVLGLVAEKLNAVTNQQERLALANELGLSAKTLKAASLATPEALAEAKTRPEFLSDEEYQKAAELSLAMDHLSTSIRLGFIKSLSQAGPELTKFAETMGQTIARVVEFVAAHPKIVSFLVEWAAKLGPVLFVGGNVLNMTGSLVTTIGGLVLLGPKVAGFFATLTGGAGAAATAATGAAGAAAGAATGLTGLLAAIAPIAAVATAAAAALWLVGKDLQLIAETKAIKRHTAETEANSKYMLQERGVSVEDTEKVLAGEMSPAEAVARAQRAGTYRYRQKPAAPAAAPTMPAPGYFPEPALMPQAPGANPIAGALNITVNVGPTESRLRQIAQEEAYRMGQRVMAAGWS